MYYCYWYEHGYLQNKLESHFDGYYTYFFRNIGLYIYMKTEPGKISVGRASGSIICWEILLK